jgi:hypothetical protein
MDETVFSILAQNHSSTVSLYYFVNFSAIIILCGLLGVAIAGYVFPSCGLFEYHHRDEDVSATSSSSYPDRLNGAHHASIGIFRYQVLDDGASCDYYSSYFFYNPNASILISQMCGLVAPFLGMCGVVLQVFAKTYRPFANLLWLFAFGAQVMTWSLVFDPSFCFQQEGDKDFATCNVTFDGYSNMIAALFFLVAYFWSMTCYRKATITPLPEPIIHVVMEPPNIVVEVPMGTSSSDSVYTNRDPFEVRDDDTSLPHDIEIQMTEPEDETIDDEEDPPDPDKEREGPDDEVIDRQGQVVKELVEHKRFQEQGKKLADKEDPPADVETADAPAVFSADVS